MKGIRISLPDDHSPLPTLPLYIAHFKRGMCDKGKSFIME